MILATVDTRFRSNHALRFLTVILFLVVVIAGEIDAGGVEDQKGFATAKEAVDAFAAALRSDDKQELLAIFGPDVKDLFISGDPVGERQRRETFLAKYDRTKVFEQQGDRMILMVGENDWPFPIPLVQQGGAWFFDTAAGKEEILNRRIGENEWSTIQTLLAVVDAQREYAMQDRNGDGIREYAQKFSSDFGVRNGLYWPVQPNEIPSPLGELVADAWAEGYAQAGSNQSPIPFHGYYFRMLTHQGDHAPGGAFDYVVETKMVGGFAVVAFPAEYGVSAIMTFIVNHRGLVYQKDLGEETAPIARAMVVFDPDRTWKPVE
jgi:hypothetical protein